MNFSKCSSVVVLGFVCLASFMLMFWGTIGDAAIMDEKAHIPSGYGYVNELDFRLNPEHPPLVKVLSALPLLALNPNFPTDDKAWTTDINGQWDMGDAFLYRAGNDADSIVRLARIGPILLTLLLIILIYVWASEFLGVWWALLPTTLFALSPTTLAHGHYVTTDIGAAFGIILSLYVFLKFLKAPTGKNLFWAGFAFGIAQLMKFSTVLLIPYLVLMAITWYLLKRKEGPGFMAALRAMWQGLVRVVVVFFIGYILVWAVYGIFMVNYPMERQVSDTSFYLRTFADGPTAAGEMCNVKRCFADINIWLAGNQITRPIAHYMLGVLMVVQRAAGGNTNYFLGDLSQTGTRTYFPIVYVLKESIPFLLMLGVALMLVFGKIFRAVREGIRNLWRRLMTHCAEHFDVWALAGFAIFYWLYTIKTPLNIGFRHLMPSIPLIYMAVAYIWKEWVAFRMPQEVSLRGLFLVLKSALATSVKYYLLLLLVLWYLAETAFAAPYFLSYFNQFGGGFAGGYRYVTDSNYDWGQDLLRLRDWVEAHPEVKRIGVDYFGGGNPEYYMPGVATSWWSAKGNPADQGIEWLAVSINALEGARAPLTNGQTREARDEYSWLAASRTSTGGMGSIPVPDFRAGTSLFIYHLTPSAK